ncbi:uncharacterized protein ARMOST_08599 [Armillaria ostoyae]|uniref:Uncharacterized protein n=1 Tax=Armillaria ostoyae TaxID=47428 RepID=A0A284R926_ARMOS|nr:uncharacterized protein ARMOST_08599 [Armillaria ostoyae]
MNAATAGGSKHDNSYCQPTSSKVLIEDMVTDEDDEIHFQEHHVPDDDEESPPPAKRWFWDCPVIPKRMAWPGNGRMPIEWNMMISNIRGIGLPMGNRIGVASDDSSMMESSDTDGFDIHARSELQVVESIGPYEFTRSCYPNKQHHNYLHQKITVGSEIGSDDFVKKLAQMHDTKEHRNHQAKQAEPTRPILRKGKEKAVYRAEDIPEL